MSSAPTGPNIPWAVRRNRVKHDWFDVLYVTKLDPWVRHLERVRLDENDLRFGPEVEGRAQRLLEWRERDGELVALVDSYASEMSPATLLDGPRFLALSVQDRAWLDAVVDALWRTRERVDERVAGARLALENAGGLFGMVEQGLAAAARGELRHAGEDEVNAARAFSSACKTLQERLARLSSRVRVT